MKLLLLSVLCLSVFAQDTNFGVQRSFGTVSGIIDRLLEGLTNSLDPVINGVGGLLTNLESAVSNLVTNVLQSLFDFVDNRISLVDNLLDEALNSKKLVDGCANRTGDLKLVKQKISDLVEECRKNLDAEIANISAELKKELDHGRGVIFTLNKSLQDCLTGLFLASCISKGQQSSLKEIQKIVKNAENLRQRLSLASADVTKCLNDTEQNGRQLASQIYREIQQCIFDAPDIK